MINLRTGNHIKQISHKIQKKLSTNYKNHAHAYSQICFSISKTHTLTWSIKILQFHKSLATHQVAAKYKT